MKSSNNKNSLLWFIGIIFVVLILGISSSNSNKKVYIKKLNGGKRMKLFFGKMFKHIIVPAPVVKDYIEVHAAILSLILATLSAYIIYSVSITDEVKSKMFQEAEKINRIDFITDFDVLNDKTLYKNLDDKNRILLIARFEQIVSNAVVMIETPELGSTIGSGQDSEIRGEEVIRTMRSISQQYPFRKPLEIKITPIGTREIVYEKRSFNDVEATGKWASDLTEVANRTNQTIYNFMLPMQKQVEAFNEKKRKKYLEGFLLNSFSQQDLQNIMHQFDKISPNREAQIFIENMKQASVIADAAQSQYEQLKAHQARNLRTNILVSRGYILTCITFVCAVLLPMIFSYLPRFLATYIPVIFYLLTLITVGTLLPKL